MALSCPITSLFEGISSGILAEAGFSDDDYLKCALANRVITLTKYTGSDAKDIAAELPDDIFMQTLDLQDGEAIFINIEDEEVTISPITEGEYVPLLAFGREEQNNK